MVSKLKLTIINDNVGREGFKNDWGWSALVESEKWTILFDADSKNEVMEYNGKKLGIDYGKISFGVLSHHHWDHRGGFEYVAKMHRNLKLYSPPGDVDLLKSWGLDVKVIKTPEKIDEDAWSSGTMSLEIKEHALGIKVDNTGVVVIVGCSHPGVDRLAKRLKDVIGEEIYLVIGGFHSPSKRVLDNLAKFSKFISPAHCSGDEAKNYVREKYPSKYVNVRTGSVIEVENGNHTLKF